MDVRTDKRGLRRVAWIAALALVAPPGPVLGEATSARTWPQWGGPTRDFKVDAPGLAPAWPRTGPRRLWSRELGMGYSGIVTDGTTLYTMLREGEEEVVHAVDAASGATVWQRRYPAPVYRDQVKDFGMGPNATPLIVGDRLVTVGFTSKLTCLRRRDGEVLWSHDLVAAFGGKVQPFGHASSPLLHDGRVVVLVGGERGAMGFDPADGSVLWDSEPFDFSYASPSVIDVGGEDQLVAMSPEEVLGVSMRTARVVWRHGHQNRFRTNCQGPWWGDDDTLFVSSHGAVGGRTLRLLRDEGKTGVREVARAEDVRIFHSSAVRLGPHLYGASGDDLVALHVPSGKQLWRERGYAEANVVWTGAMLIALDEHGRLFLARVSPQGLDLLASHNVLGKPAWTAPTLVGTRLFLRDTKSLVALELGR